MGKNAFVTLATSDEYAIGALVLCQSIRNVGTEADVVILISNGVSPGFKVGYIIHSLNDFSDTLNSTFTKVVKINELTSGNPEILNLINRPELSVTISKIHAWKLTEYEKCVFLDADCLVIKPIDELFEKPELSAVCDLGWPDCFNSGVFVFKPSQHTFDGLLNLAKTEGSFDGGDQGLLNQYFTDWLDTDINKRLSFIYNMHSATIYTYLPAFKKFGEKIKIVHFLGAVKPWHYNYNKSTGEIGNAFLAQHHMAHVSFWWNIFAYQIKEKLPNDLRTFWLPVALDSFIRMIKSADMEFKKIENDEQRFNCNLSNSNLNENLLTARLNELNLNSNSYLTQPNLPQPNLPQPNSNPYSDRSNLNEQFNFKNEQSIYKISSSESNLIQDENLKEVKLDEQNNSEDCTNPDQTTSLCEDDEILNDKGGLAGQLASLEMKKFEEDYNRKKQWETGLIDYLGVDSFENIQKKIQESIGNP